MEKQVYPACLTYWSTGMSAVRYSVNHDKDGRTDYDRAVDRHSDYRMEGNTVASIVHFQNQEERDAFFESRK